MPAVSGMIRAMAASPRVYLADPHQNVQEISSLLDIAEQRGAQLCVFPELCLTGYTCGDLFLQSALLDGAKAALKSLIAQNRPLVYVVGLPLELGGRLYNCAAVISGGETVIVAKEHLPNHSEFQERRWFSPAHSAPEFADDLYNPDGSPVRVVRESVISCGSFTLGVEICEDLWTPQPPSGRLAMQGADVIANLSAGNELVAKHAYRQQLIAQQSARCLCGYVYAGAGYGESTTDMVFSGYSAVYENGAKLAQNERFARTSTYAVADIDVERLRFRRRKNPDFSAGLQPSRPPRPSFSGHGSPRLPAPRTSRDEKLLRPLPPLPFVPQGEELPERLHEILMIQSQALIARMECIRSQTVVLGVSGGLDSTLALLAAAYAYDRAGWDKKNLIGITMPGFGTGSRTKGNADKLMELIGCTALTIPIGAAVTKHFEDIGQNPDTHDICYENSQARERTQIVMDYANKMNGLALGTGDLSELALGWCTYNGDQMSMYNLNGSVPKTLMRPLVRYAAEQLGEDVLTVVLDILDTPVSPELIPSKEGELTQRTEDTLGAYALHDFFLYHMMDSGASPKKLFALACIAFDGQYGRDKIHAALSTFVRRFFTQQFKRSAMPDGPKVGSISLSPRGDWRMPSDAQMGLFMAEVEELKAEI